jgi:DMSO/TMAO reductase YedYZ molybdopterin-dependent catalytic subunit/RimJ/RimL family protein N-acetyltransferase
MSPAQGTGRPASAPAYYLGRPASWWVAAIAGHRRTRRPRPRAPASTTGQAGGLPADVGVPTVAPRVLCQQARGAGLIVHRADPLNAETPLEVLAGGGVVPGGRFYVRNHFPVPDLHPRTWRLRVGGLARRPLTLSLAGLQAMTPVTVVATLECAGNGRSRLSPPVPGEPWGLGAVGTAAWTGVPLTEVLALAGPLPGAREVVFRGADRGPVEGRDRPVAFERALPLDNLESTGALLAYAMNGAPLPAVHGFPLRLIVPGWYGVASVKWLTNIELTDQEFGGHFQADRYRIGGELLTVQAVRSVITAPRPGQALPPGGVLITGLAWSGAAPISTVEVSIGDQPWQPATLTGNQGSHGWQRWQLPARLDQPGTITIRAKATDQAGRTQPSQPRWNLHGYATNPIHQVQVGVRSAPAEPRSRTQSRRPGHRPLAAASGPAVRLRDGSTVLIRQLQAADGPLVAGICARLSAISRWRRFLAAKRELSPAEVRYLTNLDHHDHEALAALDLRGHGVGVARYIRLPGDPHTAEIAVTVVDTWHRRGLGTELLAQLAARARHAGISRFTALTSADNVAMAALLATMRAEVINREHGTAEYEITLTATDARPVGRAAERDPDVPTV